MDKTNSVFGRAGVITISRSTLNTPRPPLMSRVLNTMPSTTLTVGVTNCAKSKHCSWLVEGLEIFEYLNSNINDVVMVPAGRNRFRTSWNGETRKVLFFVSLRRAQQESKIKSVIKKKSHDQREESHQHPLHFTWAIDGNCNIRSIDDVNKWRRSDWWR